MINFALEVTQSPPGKRPDRSALSLCPPSSSLPAQPDANSFLIRGLVRMQPALDDIGTENEPQHAQALGDSVARADHQCNENCEDWKAVAASP